MAGLLVAEALDGELPWNPEEFIQRGSELTWLNLLVDSGKFECESSWRFHCVIWFGWTSNS